MSSPAAISGSTGEQGVLDPANTNASLGLDWGNVTGAAGALIFLDTGVVRFLNSSNQLLSDVKLLPGISGFPAFPDGKLNFTSVRLPAGKYAIFYTSTYPYVPVPVQVLACQDVVLEGNGDGALATNGGMVVGPAFPGGIGSGLSPEGFGPRSGSGAAAASLYSPIGGGGGKGPLAGCTLADQVTGQLVCGFGGGALVVAAAGRITANGFIIARGFDASPSATGAQGGAGGSVRLAAVLTEGVGEIDTGGGAGPGGTGVTGPIEIQAFVQDLYTGTTAITPVRGNPPVAPIPDNLPRILMQSVSTATVSEFGFSNTGSLTTPDVTLPEATGPLSVTVEAFTTDVPLGTQLVFRAVGTDGIAVENTANVSSCECSPNEGIASASLMLNPGATYQVVVTPSAPFALARLDGAPVPLIGPPRVLAWGQTVSAGSAEASGRAAAETASLEKWARAFGVDLRAVKNLAKLRTATDHSR